MSRWFLIEDSDEPNKVKSAWMSTTDLKRFKIRGKVGDQFNFFSDMSDTKSTIVGEITGEGADFLNAITDMMSAAGADHQHFRYEVVASIVGAVDAATKRVGQKPPKTRK